MSKAPPSKETSAETRTPLQLNGLTVRVGQKQILQDITLTLGTHEFIALIGPNGAGKSTLLKTILGLVKPTHGTISIAGKSLHQSLSSAERARQLAYVPQTQPTDEFCTVGEFVALGRYPHHASWWGPRSQLDSADRRVIADALAITELETLAHRTLNTLSGGERQKALIAAALAQEPQWLLLDEPTTFLDPRSQVALWAALQTVFQQRKITVLMVTHDLNAALQLGTRIIGLKAGQIVHDAPPTAWLDTDAFQTLYDQPFRHWPDPDGNAFVHPHWQNTDGKPFDGGDC